MSEYLPPEIVFQILLNLPSKTLRRCLSVSKSWHALITCKPFVSSHLIQNPNKHNNTFFLLNLLKIHTYDYSGEFLFYLYNQTQNKEATDLLGAPYSMPGKGDNKVVGISNGLICLIQDSDTCSNPNLFLWNPAIDVFITLSSPRISRISAADMFLHEFWFDAKNSDFKVMRIVYRSNKEELDHIMDDFDLPPLAEVFSLNTEEWRRINVDDVQCYMAYTYCSHAYVNGRSHWLGCRYDPLRCLIMSFDVNDEVEVYREIMLPSVIASMYVFNVRITETMGCLAVIGNDLNEKFCRVWVMKEYGVFDSWTNLYDIPIYFGPDYYKLYGLLQNSDVLMIKNFQELAIYSSQSKSPVYLDIGHTHLRYAGIYEESLALLDYKFPDGWMDKVETTCLLKELSV